MLKRFFRYIRALFMGTMDKLEKPEVILDEAVREMKESQIKNRERAVQAITQKNNLKNMVETEERAASNLEAKATIALQQGNRELALTLLKEKGAHDKTLEQLRVSLKQAEETAQAVKVAIRRDEDRIRVKTAEALALKANMKQAEIQIQINKALDGFQFDDATQSFDRAETRIKEMQAEAEARAEVASTNINSRLAALDDIQVDAESQNALAALEAKLGLAPAATTTTVPQVTTAPAAVPADQDSLEAELAKLEQKIRQ